MDMPSLETRALDVHVSPLTTLPRISWGGGAQIVSLRARLSLAHLPTVLMPGTPCRARLLRWPCSPQAAVRCLPYVLRSSRADVVTASEIRHDAVNSRSAPTRTINPRRAPRASLSRTTTMSSSSEPSKANGQFKSAQGTATQLVRPAPVHPPPPPHTRRWATCLGRRCGRRRARARTRRARRSSRRPRRRATRRARPTASRARSTTCSAPSPATRRSRPRVRLRAVLGRGLMRGAASAREEKGKQQQNVNS